MMKIERYFDLKGNPDVSGLFFAHGSFGTVDGTSPLDKVCEGEKTTLVYRDASIRLEAEFCVEPNGVVVRRDRLYNLCTTDIELNALMSRFTLPGNAYEVYTQFNGWQQESKGAWQSLVTQVTAAAQGIRSCDGATPMMGFFDLYSKKSTVFHLIPNAQWQMTARKVAIGDRERVVLECGFFDRALRLCVAAGECIELPTVVFFTAESKTDLDAHKLHEWYLRTYPRKTLPVLYNSWLYCFDRLNIDALLCQADRAADMGFEAFMIDAGWFGTGENWTLEVGDWEENTTSGPAGRLAELSARVRERGMVFGLWFEPERVAANSRALAEHPEYYIAERLLDFSNPRAVDYILEVISAQIEKYRIGWLKFDFNDSIPNDPSRQAFYRYIQGQRDFITRLRRRYPDLYITNCASGGQRMELGQGMLFDSFWLSDNQGPLEGLRIVKDTLKRMPSALIERWNVQTYCEGLPPTYTQRSTAVSVGRMLHCNDGTREHLVAIEDAFSEAFLHGGPMGFSCDIAAFPPAYQSRWSDVIAQYKRDRDFFAGATARILADADGITAIEYADTAFSRCVIQIFTKHTAAKELVLYPALDRDAEYDLDGVIVSGKDIMENGILIQSIKQSSCRVLHVTKQ